MNLYAGFIFEARTNFFYCSPITETVENYIGTSTGNPPRNRKTNSIRGVGNQRALSLEIFHDLQPILGPECQNSMSLSAFYTELPVNNTLSTG